MFLRRFDTGRLRAVPTSAVSARHCARTEKLIAACRLGAGPASRHWAAPAGRVHIEMPFGCYQVDDAEIARRACLQLDGSWSMADTSAAGQVAIRASALWAELAWWRALQAADAWDCGEAADAGALTGFEPRRTTLVIITGRPDEAGLRALAGLERRASSWRRALRIVLVGAPMGIARHLGL